MEIIPTEMEGLMLLQPRVFEDSRGYFLESFNAKLHNALGLEYQWVQDNEARSKKRTLRGLHFQTGEHAQAKLVRVLWGEVLDVVVDLRPDSATFGKSASFILTESNHRQLLIPRGFAHGYLSLSKNVVFAYKCDNYYNPEAEGGIRFSDPVLGIDWGMDPEQLKVSEKDLKLPGFYQVKQMILGR